MAGLSLPAPAYVLQAYNNGSGFILQVGESLTVTAIDQADQTLLGVKQNGAQGWFPGHLVRFGRSPQEEAAAALAQQQQQQLLIQQQAAALAQQQALLQAHAQQQAIAQQQALIQQQAALLQQAHVGQQTQALVDQATSAALTARTATPDQTGPTQAASSSAGLAGLSSPVVAAPVIDAGASRRKHAVFRGADGLLDVAWWDRAQAEWGASLGLTLSKSKSMPNAEQASAPLSARRWEPLRQFPYNRQVNRDDSYRTGLLDCCSDCQALVCCFCLPCSLAQAQAMADGRSCNLFDLCCCPCPLQIRKQTKAKFGLPDGGCGDCLQFLFCCPLAHCADVRELKYRYGQAGIKWSCCGTMELPRQ